MQPSFRDPDGFVFRLDERVLRCVHPHAAKDLRAFLSSAAAGAWMASGALSSSTALPECQSSAFRTMLPELVPPGAIFLEHEPIPFPSYPYEWAPEMLHAAAELTLRLAREAVGAGFALKDATPYNIMFDGPKPVFLDVLSFTRGDPLETVWWPYGQFIRTFVYPMLAVRHFGMRLDELLLPNRDGLEPERIMRLCSPFRRWLPPFLGAVTIPALLSGRSHDPEEFHRRPARDSAEAGFILGRVFRRASRMLGGHPAPVRRSAASRYMDSGHTYTAQQLQKKESVVTDALRRARPASLLDIGCNTGHFSLLAARHTQHVVAIDHDPDSVGVLWRDATQRNANVLPLVIDIARPPGACGWANRECASFLDRARGKFDCVLLLALVHHLLVNERVPLDGIFELAAGLTTQQVIAEYIDPADPQFQRMARGRQPVHADFTPEFFETAAKRRFDIIESHELTPTRRIYVLQRREAGIAA